MGQTEKEALANVSLKILLVNDFSPDHSEASGAELIVQSLSRNFKALGHEVYLATSYGVSDFKLRSRTLGAWVNPYNVLTEQTFRRLLEKLGPDIVHFHNIRHVGLSPLKAALESETPCLYSLHDYLPLCPQRTMYREGANCTHFECCFMCFYGSARQWPIRTVAQTPLHPLLNRMFLKPLRSSILRRTNHVQKTVPTIQMLTWLERFGLERVKVVTPGVDFENSADSANGRELLALPTDACVIGYYGRLSVEKGTTLLSQAWRTIARDFPSAYLVTTGKGSPHQDLSVPRVIHLGKLRDDIFARLVSSTDIVVAPSVWEEPFNLSVTAALAMGKPVVATAVGGHLGQVTHGVNGFLSRSEPSEFARYIIELIKNSDLRHRMGSAAHKTYLEKFTGKSSALSYIETYRSLMNH